MQPRASGKWVRGIGRPGLVTLRRYVPVRVDLAERLITGLPRRRHQALSTEILVVAHDRQEEPESTPDLQPTPQTTARKETPLVPAQPPATGRARPTPLSTAARKPRPAAVVAPEFPQVGGSFPWLDDSRRSVDVER
ncbi:hypothetical protein OG735_18175 [Streptomyces sp. NBC_01210]|uniref:hypothetical protein n=1 Tax=Streptomyces sp. NBC_01210 TaxID=2903774 RepID=UPI002E112FAA|nr:hypothetical protein OG735_18175 [Streptomyces sp. NBC_01210]